MHPNFSLGAVNNRSGKADPGVLAVFQDYIKLMPLVAEANQMNEELKKVRARKWGNVRPSKEHKAFTPTAPNWLGGIDQTEAWRGEVLCPRPCSKLVTEPQPTPRPYHLRPWHHFLKCTEKF